MNIVAHSLLIPILGLLAAADPDANQPVQLDEPQFRIEIPEVVLTDVPVSRIRITAHDSNGEFDPTYNGQPYITGIRYSLVERRVDGTFRNRKDRELPPFENGVLELKTDLANGERVYITSSEIVVDPDSRRRGSVNVHSTLRWFSILPPLLAIGLAIWMRNIIVALFAAIWSGAVILSGGDFFQGFLRTLDTYIIGELVQVSDGRANHDHMMIILFTMFLGATVGVMGRSGGTQAMVMKMARFTTTRERGQLVTWAMGLVIFFDDYANTLLVGSTMRPITDRLKISREKLAFLVDSTAAPVAGLAIISTWVGVEIGYIEDTFTDLYRNSNIEVDAYTTFLSTITYRFYPLYLLVFVWLIAYSGNDFGPMLKAETRALANNQLVRPGSNASTNELDQLSFDDEKLPLFRNAMIPISVLLILILVGLWWTGSNGLIERNLLRQQAEKELLPSTMWSILSSADSTRVLFLSSFVASISAISIAVVFRSLTMKQGIDAWAAGAKSMFFATLILVMAWSVATLCDSEHLNTSGFLVEAAQGKIDAKWMPSLAFLLSAAVSFATGSSWATMGLLLPLFMSFTFFILVGENDIDPNNHLMLATIGAVLAGAIFGDHCSPISDTTVLSSAACGSDHLDHVSTQLPYAASVALVSLVFGYIPVGFGFSPLLVLPLGLIVLYLIVEFLGRSVEQCAKELEETELAAEAAAKEAADKAAEEADAPAASKQTA